MEVKEVATADLKPGDRVWYFIKKHVKQRKGAPPQAHGPFTVVGTDPKFVLRNGQNVEVPLDADLLILLTPTESPPKLY